MRAWLVLVTVVVAVGTGGVAAAGDATVVETQEVVVVHEPTIEVVPAPTVATAPESIGLPPRDRVAEEYHSSPVEILLGITAPILSIVYTPVRVVWGIAGASLGGVAGWTTGGDLRSAHAIWRPTVEGDYFIRPDHLDGTESFEFSNVRPVVHRRYAHPSPPRAPHL